MEVVLVIAVICGIFIFFWLGGEKGTYRAGHNPAVRYCVDCGQQQFAYCAHMTEWDNDWWEPNGEINDSTCQCHKDTK